jgi:hypothetical protein
MLQQLSLVPCLLNAILIKQFSRTSVTSNHLPVTINSYFSGYNVTLVLLRRSLNMHLSQDRTELQVKPAAELTTRFTERRNLQLSHTFISARRVDQLKHHAKSVDQPNLNSVAAFGSRTRSRCCSYQKLDKAQFDYLQHVHPSYLLCWAGGSSRISSRCGRLPHCTVAIVPLYVRCCPPAQYLLSIGLLYSKHLFFISVSAIEAVSWRISS